MIFNGFDGLQLVPNALAGTVRAALSVSGMNPEAITPSGELNPGAMMGLAFNTVTIRSTLGNFTMNLNGPEDPATAALLSRIQPSIVFSGRAGTYTIAPYGQTGAIDPSIQSAGVAIGIGVGLGLLGILFVGRALANRQ